jgi:hypothetical protein
MPRAVKLAGFAGLLLFALSLSAQQNPFAGSWKLNVAKSNFGAGQPPKSETRTVAAVGNGEKITFRGTAADGSKIDYTFTSNLDGKIVPVTGSGSPGGTDSVAVTRPDAHTTRAVLYKAGKQIGVTTTVVAADGKTTTQTRKTTDAQGNPVTQTVIWERSS